MTLHKLKCQLTKGSRRELPRGIDTKRHAWQSYPEIVDAKVFSKTIDDQMELTDEATHTRKY
jgi:hypothetical protein